MKIEVGSERVWRRIAEGQNFEFAFLTLPEEKTVAFTNYKTVSPLSLIRNLWRDTAVLGYGNFELKVVLDVPLTRDVVERTTFRVKKKSVDEN
ncbi:hypothetical protein [Thermococcus sp.]